jgi:hypothetical protein
MKFPILVFLCFIEIAISETIFDNVISQILSSIQKGNAEVESNSNNKMPPIFNPLSWITPKSSSELPYNPDTDLTTVLE